MRDQKGAGACDLFWLVHTHERTHTKSELAGELRQNVNEGHACQMCQVKSH